MVSKMRLAVFILAASMAVGAILGAGPRVTIAADPETITFSDPSTFSGVEGTAFDEGSFRATAFWFQGASPTSGHFHGLSSGFEDHHFQGDTERQGVKIERIDGGDFCLASLDYRNQESPIEIGTAAPNANTTPPAGYKEYDVADSSDWQTLDVRGDFDSVSEVWITSRLNGEWDNVVLDDCGETSTSESPSRPRRNVAGGVANLPLLSQTARENRERAAAAAQPVVVPPSTGSGVTISPPSTGDGGLVQSQAGPVSNGTLLVLAAGTAGLGLSALRVVNRRR